MLVIYILQTLVPLLLLAWLYCAPPRSASGFWVQAIATWLALLALGMLGLWQVPARWTPHLLMVSLLLTTLAAVRRRHPFASLVPASLQGWLGLGGFGVLAAFALGMIGVALQGRTPPAGSIELDFPLEAGNYLVLNGGSNQYVNAHYQTLDPAVPRYARWRGQSMGIDLVALQRFGRRSAGLLPADPAAYYIFGARVLAPCNGAVVAARSDLPDMRVPEVDRDNLAGNHVILRCAGVDIVLAHFRQGSVAVSAGATVQSGDLLGEVGNSGNSNEPHLHIHAQTPGTAAEPLAGEPLPLKLAGRFLVRNQRFRIGR